MQKFRRKLLDKFELRGTGLLRDSALAFFIRGLGATAAFLMSLAVARSLPVKEAGYFFLAFTVVSVLAPIGLMGTNTASLRFIGGYAEDEEWAKTRKVALTTWRWAGTLLMFGSLLLWFTSSWVGGNIFDKPSFGMVLRNMSPSLLLMGGCILLSAQLQALRRITQSIVVVSIGVPFGVACGVWLLPVSTALDVVKLYVASGVVTVALGFYWWHRAVPSVTEDIPIQKSALWASCVPMWIVAVVGVCATWGSQLIAGLWVSAEEVAKLAVAQRTANLVSFVLVAVNFVVAPRFAALYQQKRFTELRNLSLRSVRIMSFFGAPVVLFLCIFNETVMGIFGYEFRDAGVLLAVLSLGQFVNVVTGSVVYLLYMSGHEKDMRNVMLFAGPFAVVAALLLIPLYGVMGAAISTAMAVSVQNLGAVWFVRRRLGFNTLAIWQRF